MSQIPKPGEFIEVWCGESCNRLGHGQIIEMVADNRVRFANEWLDGSLHEGEWDLEPGTLELASDGSAWFACVRSRATR